MKRKLKGNKGIISFLLALLVLMLCYLPVHAEEYYDDYEEEYYEEDEEEEEEYIPEEYYDPIQSNEIPGWPQGPAVQAASAVVMDLDTNTFLYSKSAYDKKYPASITKIMTCLLALENGDLDEEIEFSEVVFQIEEDSSHVGIQPGEKMTLRRALYALMLESANDVANGLAEHFGGSLSGFADMMNEKAASLGCVNTHFVNPQGLHNDDHYTCAYDMALIAQAAYQNPEFREICSTTQSYCPPTNLTEEERYFVNHHKLIQPDSDFYYDYCTGGKTGFTSMAWNTLVSFAEKDNMRLVCVVLHENGAANSYDETKMLFDYGFYNFNRIAVTQEKEPIFYQAMKSGCVGKVKKMYQQEHLNEYMATWFPSIVNVPSGTEVAELVMNADWLEQGTGKIHYEYNGAPVGSIYVEYNKLGQLPPLAYEKNIIGLQHGVSMTKASTNEIEQTAKIVLDKAQEIFGTGFDYVVEFTENNKLLVIMVGSLILLVLLIIIIILILRCSKDSRIQKKRRQAEKAMLKREEEIDRMTMAEIEQELREAMDVERERQQKEYERMEVQRKEEEKLRETEEIIAEINGKKGD